MKMDTSSEGTKKSLVGFGAFILVLGVFYYLDMSGLLGFILAIVAWYVASNAVGKGGKTEKND